MLARSSERHREFLRSKGIDVDAPIDVPLPPPPPRAELVAGPKTFRQGPKPTRKKQRGNRRQQRQREREQDERSDRERYDRMVGELRARGKDARPALVPRAVVRMCRQCMQSRNGGRTIRMYASRGRNPVLMGAIERAALGADKQRSWDDDRNARGIATYALLQDALATYTHRRHGRFGGVVMGYPQSLILKLLKDRDGYTPGKTVVFGVHRPGGTTDRGRAGWARAFGPRGLDVMYQQRLPPSQCEPHELLGESGYATARYWLPTLAVELIANPRARVDWFGWSDAFSMQVQHWRLGRAPPLSAAA